MTLPVAEIRVNGVIVEVDPETGTAGLPPPMSIGEYGEWLSTHLHGNPDPASSSPSDGVTREELPALAEGILRLAYPCPACLDTGHVCEIHPSFPFGEHSDGHDGTRCGMGIPCPACCSPVRAGATRSVTEAFTPDWQRDPAGS